MAAVAVTIMRKRRTNGGKRLVVDDMKMGGYATSAPGPNTFRQGPTHYAGTVPQAYGNGYGYNEQRAPPRQNTTNNPLWNYGP